LTFLKIWHDNSGKGDKASWFLNQIIVHDLQTKEKFYFLCRNWLAVEYNDGKIERELFIACDNGYKDIVKLLLQHKDIDINIPNDKNQTPLDIAYQKGHTDIIQLLLEYQKK
jgi:ankyrin repeat protein